MGLRAFGGVSDRVSGVVDRVRGRVRLTATTVLTSLVLVLVLAWISVFLYGWFYFVLIPDHAHSKQIHFQFSSKCKHEKRNGLCSFPSANISLLTESYQQFLAGGQAYKVDLELHMPESTVNKQLGMFMITIDFLSQTGSTIYTASRATMIRYKSNLYEMIETLFYVPLMIFGYVEQKQTLHVEFCNKYIQDPYKPAFWTFIQVESRNIEIYDAKIHFYAQFSGVRYVLHRWPLFSAVVGIGVNMLFLTLLVLISWYNLSSRKETKPESEPLLQQNPLPVVDVSAAVDESKDELDAEKETEKEVGVEGDMETTKKELEAETKEEFVDLAKDEEAGGLRLRKV